jgi:hypothetical protein
MIGSGLSESGGSCRHDPEICLRSFSVGATRRGGMPPGTDNEDATPTRARSIVVPFRRYSDGRKPRLQGWVRHARCPLLNEALLNEALVNEPL